MQAIYPGSFDPITLGHLDIIRRASKIFDKLLVLVSDNPDKQGKIPTDIRIKLIEEATKDLKNIELASYGGLVVDYAKKNNFDVLIRGMRGASDFESELEMSQVNNELSGGLETLLLMTSPEHSFIRASRVWELLSLGGDISGLVPSNVENYLKGLYVQTIVD